MHNITLTIGGESKLSADHRGSLIVPEVIKHSSVPPSNANFYSASQKSVLGMVGVRVTFKQKRLISLANYVV